MLQQVATALASGICFGKWHLLWQVAFALESGYLLQKVAICSGKWLLLWKVAFALASGFCSGAALNLQGASNSLAAIATLSTVYHHK